MCGLFAGLGKLNTNRMIALGCMNEDRGMDSVGIAYLKSDGVHIAKIAERPAVALNVSLRKEVTEAAISGMFIGHTRFATKGEVTSENAHPFMAEDIVFAHNGIIQNYAEFGKYDVDSQSLIHGIKAKDFSKYIGPIALVWIENRKLTAYRKGNPLFRGLHNGTLYLASEKEQLQSIGCVGIKELKEGFIYTFHSAVRITTKKVKENRLYDVTSLPYAGYNWQDEYHKAMNREYSVQKENFNTWKDDRASGKHCLMCADEIPAGTYCQDCGEWEREVLSKDLPPSCEVGRYQK